MRRRVGIGCGSVLGLLVVSSCVLVALLGAQGRAIAIAWGGQPADYIYVTWRPAPQTTHTTYHIVALGRPFIARYTFPLKEREPDGTVRLGDGGMFGAFRAGACYAVEEYQDATPIRTTFLGCSPLVPNLFPFW